MLRLNLGSVAELADALDLGSSTARCAGSIPVTPIRIVNLAPDLVRGAQPAGADSPEFVL